MDCDVASCCIVSGVEHRSESYLPLPTLYFVYRFASNTLHGQESSWEWDKKKKKYKNYVYVPLWHTIHLHFFCTFWCPISPGLNFASLQKFEEACGWRISSYRVFHKVMVWILVDNKKKYEKTSRVIVIRVSYRSFSTAFHARFGNPRI